MKGENALRNAKIHHKKGLGGIVRSTPSRRPLRSNSVSSPIYRTAASGLRPSLPRRAAWGQCWPFSVSRFKFWSTICRFVAKPPCRTVCSLPSRARRPTSAAGHPGAATYRVSAAADGMQAPRRRRALRWCWWLRGLSSPRPFRRRFAGRRRRAALRPRLKIPRTDPKVQGYRSVPRPRLGGGESHINFWPLRSRLRFFALARALRPDCLCGHATAATESLRRSRRELSMKKGLRFRRTPLGIVYYERWWLSE